MDETGPDARLAGGPAASAPSGGSASAGLRVVIVSTSFPRDPQDFAGHFVLRLAEALARRGHSIEVVVPHAAGLAYLEDWEVDGAAGRPLRVVRFRYAPDALEKVAYGDGIPSNLKRDPLALLALAPFVWSLRRSAARASQRADVVHAQWAPTAALANSHRLAAPMVVTLHGSDVRLASRGGLWEKVLLRGLRPPTMAVIAVSHELVQQLCTIVPASMLLSLSTIPTGVEASLLERPVPARLKRSPVSVAFVGRLLESKGVLDLARAFLTMHEHTRLVIAGDGPARAAMAEILAGAAGDPTRIEFLGPVDRETALDVMAGADLVAMPSHAEGAGLVALEASAMGKCVIGSRTGIMPDVLSPRQLVDPFDVDALAERLRILAGDARRRERLGRLAKARVAACFTWETLAEQVEMVYLRAVSGTPAGQPVPDEALALHAVSDETAAGAPSQADPGGDEARSTEAGS